MFVGHYSAAFLAKRVAPEIPLPVYFIACQTIDLFWATFVLLGIEKVRYVAHITASNSMDLYFMPFSHSLPAALAWSAGIAGLYWLLAKSNPQRVRNTILFGVVVLSHWMLDFFAHRPDLPLWYDSFKVGLGLWNFRIFEYMLELVLLWTSLFFALKVAGQNRQRFISLGIVMTAFQTLSVLVPTPELDYKIALQLLVSYSLLTVFSYWASRKPAQ
ncbi:MAG TPA: hypothetical protein VIF82_17570 [Burkholderiaceae bacterium]|jgi:pimeloyl-ACP methyl ester carboxylesterase